MKLQEKITAIQEKIKSLEIYFQSPDLSKKEEMAIIKQVAILKSLLIQKDVEFFIGNLN
jgi:uncharacterized coiled-coil DUF342 family protein